MKKNNRVFISFFFVLLSVSPSFIVLNSCKKQSSFSIKYGDVINCLDPKKNNYVAIENLKNAMKKIFVVNPPREFTKDEFEKLTEKMILKRNNYVENRAITNEMYFELIMSLIDHEDKGFELKWDCSDKYLFNHIEIVTSLNKKNIFVSVQYTQKDNNIYLNLITENGISKLIKSYKFKYCLIK